MKKTVLTPAQGKLMLYPVTAAMVSCADGEEKNIIAITFIAPVSATPPTAMISVLPTRHSYEMIKKSGEYVINIPGPELLYETQFIGRKSGKDVDKFRELGLTAIPAQKVKAPLIEECWGHIECKVVGEYPAGAHTMFVGEIVAASCNEGFFEGGIKLGKDHARMIEFLGGNKYGIVERYEEAPTVKE